MSEVMSGSVGSHGDVTGHRSQVTGHRSQVTGVSSPLEGILEGKLKAGGCRGVRIGALARGGLKCAAQGSLEDGYREAHRVA